MSEEEDKKVQHVTCNSCGIEFSFGTKVSDMWRKSQKTFYCPNGHGLQWSGESAEQKEMSSLKKQVAELTEKLATAVTEVAEQTKKMEELSSELEIWKPASAKEVV